MRMAIVRTVWTDEQGNQKSNISCDDPTKMVLVTGPVYGTKTTQDGTPYNVSPDHIEIDPAHFGDLDHEIGLHHEQNGHPAHSPEFPLVHVCTVQCPAAVRRTADQVVERYNELLSQAGNDAHIGTAEHAGFVASLQDDHARLNPTTEA